LTDQIDLSAMLDDLTLDDIDLIESSTGLAFDQIDTASAGVTLRVAGFIVCRIRNADAAASELWKQAGTMTIRQVMEAMSDPADPSQPGIAGTGS